MCNIGIRYSLAVDDYVRYFIYGGNQHFLLFINKGQIHQILINKTRQYCERIKHKHFVFINVLLVSSSITPYKDAQESCSQLLMTGLGDVSCPLGGKDNNME